LSSTTKKDASTLLGSAIENGASSGSEKWKEAARSGQYNNGKIFDE
jgi:hypothetical protein